MRPNKKQNSYRRNVYFTAVIMTGYGAANYFAHEGSGTDTDWTSKTLGLGSKEMVSIPADAVTVWLEYPIHCAALMYSVYTSIGMASVPGSPGLSVFRKRFTPLPADPSL